MKILRRKRLNELLKSPRFNGSRSDFLSSAGITKGRLAQLLNPSQAFGDAAARNLCEALGLPSGFFECEDSAAETVFSAQASPSKQLTIEEHTAGLAAYFEQMDDNARQSAADALRGLALAPSFHARAAALLMTAFQSGKRKAA